MNKQFHCCFKITDMKSGEFYICKHSTYNLRDNYMGSGTWITNHPNPKILRKELICFTNTAKEAYDKEVLLINKYKTSFLCKNIITTKQSDAQRRSIPIKVDGVKYVCASHAERKLKLRNGCLSQCIDFNRKTYRAKNTTKTYELDY